MTDDTIKAHVKMRSFIGADARYTEEDLDTAIRLARASEREAQWVSVEDRLPEIGIPVIVDGGVAFRANKAWITLTGEASGQIIQWEVSHWMPLPQPPTT